MTGKLAAHWLVMALTGYAENQLLRAGIVAATAGTIEQAEASAGLAPKSRDKTTSNGS
jgi:hypothetical protein